MAPTTATKKHVGVSAKATVPVSRIHPKDKVTQAYPNSTKDERSVEIVVLDRGSRPICRETKLVVVFNHPPRGDLQEGLNAGQSNDSSRWSLKATKETSLMFQL